MYLHNIHILFYVLFCVLGVISAQISAWLIKVMPEHKKVLSKDFFKEFKLNYPLIIITVVVYFKQSRINKIHNSCTNVNFSFCNRL